MGHFIGRENELKELDSILKNAKGCVLSGMAGIGKTSLVFQYINNRQDSDSTFTYRYLDVCANVDLSDTILGSEHLDLIVFDEIEDVDSFIEKYQTIIDSLDLVNIILVTRVGNCRNSNYSEYVLLGLSNDELLELLNCTIGDLISDLDRKRIITLSDGHPLFINIIASLIEQGSYSVSEIIEKIQSPENIRLLPDYLIRQPKDGELTNDEEEALLNIAIFGDIEVDLFERWSGFLNCQSILSALRKHNLVQIENNRIYSQVISDKLVDKTQNTSRCYAIAKNILQDIRNGIDVEDKYPVAIIRHLRACDEAVEFVASYFESKMNHANQFIDFNNDLKKVLESVEHIKQSVYIVKEVVQRTDEKTDYLIDSQNQIFEIILHLKSVYKEDADAIEKLNYLYDAAKAPEKFNIGTVNTIIGFLGSISSTLDDSKSRTTFSAQVPF